MVDADGSMSDNAGLVRTLNLVIYKWDNTQKELKIVLGEMYYTIFLYNEIIGLLLLMPPSAPPPGGAYSMAPVEFEI